MDKSENYSSNTIAVYDLKVGRCIERNDLRKLHKYQRSRSLLVLSCVSSSSNFK